MLVNLQEAMWIQGLRFIMPPDKDLEELAIKGHTTKRLHG